MEKNLIKEIRRIRGVITTMSRPSILLEQDFGKVLKFFSDFSDDAGRIAIKNLPREWKSASLMKQLKGGFKVKGTADWEELLNKYAKGQLDEVRAAKLMVLLGENIKEMRPFLKTELTSFLTTRAAIVNKSFDDFLVETLNNPKSSKQFQDEWLEIFGTKPPYKTLKELVSDGGLEGRMVVLFQEVKGWLDKFKRTNSSQIMDQLDNAVIEGLGGMNLYGKNYMELQELFNTKFGKIFDMADGMNYNSLEELVEELGTAISKGESFNSMMIDDLYKLLKTQDGPKKIMMNYLRNNKLLKKQFQEGKLTDASIEELLGGNARKLDVDDLKSSWTKKVIPVIGKTWNGMKDLATNLSFWKWFAISQIGSIIGSSIIQLARIVKYSDKALAGTHQDFYAQIRGAKDIVLNEGGYSDEKAKELANRLYVLFNYWSNNEEEITEWITTNQELLSIGGVTSDESLANFTALTEDNGTLQINQLRYIFGVDDGSIVKFYENPPNGEVGTILAASQICYFYETEITKRKDSLWTTFKSMQAYFTAIPVFQHMLDEGEEQITESLDLKPWGWSVDKTTIKMLEVINSFYDTWPTFPPNLKGPNGEILYSYYEGRIPIDYLADISNALDYTGPGTGGFVDHQAWLDKLTAEQFNTAYCTRATAVQKNCDNPYTLSKSQYVQAKEDGEIEILMDEEKFKSATQAVVDQIMSDESQSWLATFITSYQTGTEDGGS